MEEKGITKVFHGNDPVFGENGVDVYLHLKERNYFENFERTEFVSTTDLIGKMLYRRKYENFENYTEKTENFCAKKKKYFFDLLKKFEIPKKEKKGRIVYVDGTFDLFHAGNASFLENARLQGDYLIVGIHSSKDSHKEKGVIPIQSLVERQITVSGIKYVDEIIPNSPFYINEEFIKSNKIDVIVYGKCIKYYENVKNIVEIKKIVSDFPYLSSQSIISRIIDNYDKYYERNIKRGHNIDDSLFL